MKKICILAILFIIFFVGCGNGTDNKTSLQNANDAKQSEDIQNSVSDENIDNNNTSTYDNQPEHFVIIVPPKYDAAGDFSGGLFVP